MAPHNKHEAITAPPLLWTIGHSTRSSEEFVALLRAYDIQRLIDIRRYPGSRRYPHFHSDALTRSFAEAGLDYEHMPALGGRRATTADSPNKGWKNAGFRGYADYMQTEEFQSAIEALMVKGRTSRTSVMCAEAVPWRCHRSLVADALVSRGWEVHHILSPDRVQIHRLTSFAVIQTDRLIYPAPADQDAPPRLF
jgi:uncharacterized protein (DUF488 family)